MCVVTAICKEI